VEEAQTLSNRSLSLLRPTIRVEGSQLWANWNPRRKSDAIDEFLRVKKPENAIVVKANWRDNPWFPDVLNEERPRPITRGSVVVWRGRWLRRSGAQPPPTASPPQ
jgi:hypothetical protein